MSPFFFYKYVLDYRNIAKNAYEAKIGYQFDFK